MNSLERTLSALGRLLLELLDGTLVDSTTLVNQVPSGGTLTGVDVTNHDLRGWWEEVGKCKQHMKQSNMKARRKLQLTRLQWIFSFPMMS